MKRKKLIDEMLEDGSAYYGRRSDGVIVEKGKPVAAAEIEAPPAVAPATLKPTVVPPVTAKKQPEVVATQQLYGLARSIAAATGKPTTSPIPKKDEPFGLARSIAANVAQAEAKKRK